MTRLLPLSPILAAAAMTVGCATKPEPQGVATILTYTSYQTLEPSVDMITPVTVYSSIEECIKDGTNIFERVARARYDAEIKAINEKAKSSGPGNYFLPSVAQVCVDVGTGKTEQNYAVVPDRLSIPRFGK